MQIFVKPSKNAAIWALLVTGLILTMTPGVVFAQSKIAVSINNGIVTTNQLTQRSRFLRLSGAKGDVKSDARKQLIDEELQTQEATRIGLSISEKAVEEAFGRVAKSNKFSSAQFSSGLRARGVNPNTLKQLIKARILWQQFVVARARSEGKQSSSSKDITSILFNRGGDGKNRKVKEYTIEQIIFVLKRDASKNAAKQRLREVEAFRRSNNSCEEAAASAKKLASSGVIMKSLGRFTSDTLPANMKDDVVGAEEKLFTAPKRGETGIGTMAICKTREIVDNNTTGDFSLNVGQLNNKELQKKSEQWLAELHERSTIVVRN